MIKLRQNSAKVITDGGYKRGLKNRHIQLIALGGIIGSGYFLGSGEIINQVGPSVFLAYIFGGFIVYLTMICMGELAVSIPTSGSFVSYTSDFISPSIACGVGWSYWVSWIAYIPAECIAGGIIMEGFTAINGYIWAMVFASFITYINILKVDMFGEVEFWLSLIKIFALLVFVIVAVLIFFGFIHGDQPSEIIGKKFIFEQGGFFPQGIPALFTAMVLLLVNYQGSEIVGLAAGESMNPEKMIPSAIRQVTLRIIFIYIIPIFCVVLIFPWQKANINNPVFSDALNFYGLHWIGTVTSFITLSATISCSNSGLYGTVRSLNALARGGMAPHKLGNLNHNAVPQNAVIFTIIAIWLMLFFGYFFGQSIIYIALLIVSGFTGLTAWISICLSQIIFRKRLYKAGYSISDLKYKTPFYPYSGVIAIILMLICMISLVTNNDITYRIAFIIGITSFIAPIIIYKITKKKNSLLIDEENKPLQFVDIFPEKYSVD